MGLLAPLYALAALAVAAPILFHLIRRQPRGQSEFSSLMFLQPSPPRLTRRSRLDNLLLLLLRAAALILIALAFARPFMRSVELADSQLAAREILVLVDTSGSMQREDVWRRAVSVADQYIEGLGESDQVGLASFDSKLQMQVSLPRQDEAGSAPRASQSAVLAALHKLKPSYEATRLADSLIAAVETLQERSTSAQGDDNQREIVLISDLHEGCGIEALQGFAWPAGVRLDVRVVSPERPGNARATLMQSLASDSSSTSAPANVGENSIRVRIENNKSSDKVDMQLQWEGVPDSAPVRLQVPPGQVRVIPVAYPSVAVSRLLLSGDAAGFDNQLDVPRTAPRLERIGFVGKARDKPEEDAFFFLSQIPFSTPVRTVNLERTGFEQLSAAAADASLAGLVIETPLELQHVKLVKQLVEAGKPVVIALSRGLADGSPETQATMDALTELLDVAEPIRLRESTADKFALWTEIDFRHPLFLPLADGKFNDFGKIRFWSHRILELPESAAPGDVTTLERSYRVLARFDDRSPAIIHRRLGQGDLWVMAAGWQATGSQLALSTKFVPLMYGMFDLQGRAMAVDAVYEVGEPISIASPPTSSLTTIDGTPIPLSADEKTTIATPGLYWLIEDGKRRQISVTLPATESQLDPMDVERFSQYGVITGKSNSAEELRATARLFQAYELEGRQKIWRWMLVAAIGIMIIETFLAWRTSVQ